MEKTGLMNSFLGRVGHASVTRDELVNTTEQKRYHDSLGGVIDELINIRNSGDVALILQAELALYLEEREKRITGKEQSLAS